MGWLRRRRPRSLRAAGARRRRIRPRGDCARSGISGTRRDRQSARAVRTARTANGCRVDCFADPDCWDLKGVAAAYRGFVARFRAVRACARRRRESGPEQCFVLRTLLIHEFRRVTLHDPQLPAELLPENWPEATAYALCAGLYRRVHAGAERYLAAALEESPRARPSSASQVQEWFGGLRAG